MSADGIAETAVILLGLCALFSVASLTVLIYRRKLTGTTRAQQDGPKDSAPAAGPDRAPPAASPSGSGM